MNYNENKEPKLSIWNNWRFGLLWFVAAILAIFFILSTFILALYLPWVTLAAYVFGHVLPNPLWLLFVELPTYLFFVALIGYVWLYFCYNYVFKQLLGWVEDDEKLKKLLKRASL